jgi:hypothetical protein
MNSHTLHKLSTHKKAVSKTYRQTTKLYLSKKGSEKPIEIFIALFVILAVAMVLLRMFGGQITEKQKELKALSDQNRLEQTRKDVKNFCDQKCADVSSTIDKITYCKTKYGSVADFNDNSITDEYNGEFSIVGICEDTIYCASIIDCKSLTIKTCAQIMCNYFKSEFGDGVSNATARLRGFLSPGSCYESLTPEQKANHWFTLSEPFLSCK